MAMGSVQIILGVIIILFSIGIIAVVLFQEGHQKNLGAISGGADNFLGKTKARGVDAMLERITKFVAIGFFVVVVVVNVIVFLTQTTPAAN